MSSGDVLYCCNKVISCFCNHCIFNLMENNVFNEVITTGTCTYIKIQSTCIRGEG